MHCDRSHHCCIDPRRCSDPCDYQPECESQTLRSPASTAHDRIPGLKHFENNRNAYIWPCRFPCVCLCLIFSLPIRLKHLLFIIYIDKCKDNNHHILWFNKKKMGGINEVKIKGLDLFRQILIESGKGIRPNEVQFPYNNLKKYLESRGFNHLLEYIKWGPSDVTNSDGGFKDPNDQNNDKVSKEGQRSKTVINRAKIRIAFYLPENTINIIRNEAHIRLASSMWYAAKYTLNLSYFAVLFVIICMAFNLKMPYGLKPFILFCAFIILMLGYYFGRKAKSEMDNNNFEEELPQKKSEVEKLVKP